MEEPPVVGKAAWLQVIRKVSTWDSVRMRVKDKVERSDARRLGSDHRLKLIRLVQNAELVGIDGVLIVIEVDQQGYIQGD